MGRGEFEVAVTPYEIANTVVLIKHTNEISITRTGVGRLEGTLSVFDSIFVTCTQVVVVSGV